MRPRFRRTRLPICSFKVPEPHSSVNHVPSLANPTKAPSIPSTRAIASSATRCISINGSVARLISSSRPARSITLDRPSTKLGKTHGTVLACRQTAWLEDFPLVLLSDEVCPELGVFTPVITPGGARRPLLSSARKGPANDLKPGPAGLVGP